MSRTRTFPRHREQLRRCVLRCFVITGRVDRSVIADPTYPPFPSAMGGRESRPASEPAPAEPVPPTPVKIKLGDFAIDEYRPIKVLVIGAGFSGILAGIRYVL